MGRETEAMNRRLLRARDAMDRAYTEPLNIPAVTKRVPRERALGADPGVLHSELGQTEQFRISLCQPRSPTSCSCDLRRRN